MNQSNQSSELSAVTRDRIMRFHARLLSHAPVSPIQDFPEICDAWREATDADWVWMWMYNDLSCQWELTAYDSKFDADVLLTEMFTWPDTTSILEFVHRIDAPVVVTEVENWQVSHIGEDFGIPWIEQLVQMGCNVFCTVPLLSPRSPQDETTPGIDLVNPIRGAVSFHYRTRDDFDAQPDDVLLLMGWLTASIVRNSYQAEHRSILGILNELAEKHLTSVRRRHGAARGEYLDALIALIQQQLNTRAVSIFYQVPFENRVECLATTGLCDTNASSIISKDDLSQVTYEANEGLIGQCFASGEAAVRLRNAARHSPKYIEIMDGAPLRNVAVCYCPIPKASYEETLPDQPKSHGVIRCVDPHSPLRKEVASSFSPTALKKLAFIARQAAPVLHNFAIRVQREFAISIIRHDLETPLNMICDTAEDIGTYVDSDQRIRWHDLMNLKTSAAFAQNLLDQLDPDPFEVADPEIEETLLEGHIVARLRHMLEHFAKLENDISIKYSGFSGSSFCVPPLFVDRALVERAFWNLLVNAIKYSNEGSTVEVKARVITSGIEVEVKNQGIGVTPEDRGRIFQPGYRGRSAMLRKQGLGLGLSIARRAMEKHGGTLNLTKLSDPTVFTMFFPQYLQNARWNS